MADEATFTLKLEDGTGGAPPSGGGPSVGTFTPPSAAAASERSQRTAAVGMAAQVATAAGYHPGPAVAGAAVGFAQGGVVGAGIGAAIGAVQEFREGIEHQIERIANFSKSVAAFDAPGFTRGAVELATSVPVIGGAVAKMGTFILDLSEGIHGTAVNLARYSGELAGQQARFRVTDILRDIDRAQRFSPEIAGAEEERFKLNQQVKDLQDRLFPVITKFTTDGLAGLNKIIPLLSPIVPLLEGLRVVAGATGTGLTSLIPSWITLTARATALVVEIADRQRIQRAADDPNNLLFQFLQTALPAGNEQAWRDRFEEERRARNPNAPFFP
jgi:hypothetical protein